LTLFLCDWHLGKVLKIGVKRTVSTRIKRVLMIIGC